MGQASQVAGDEAPDGDEIVLGELGVEELLELLDLRRSRHGEVERAVLGDLGLFGVVFVLDLPDDLFDGVLHGHQSRDAAVLVDDDGHLLLDLLELAQEIGEGHGLGDEGDGPDQGLDRLALVLLVGVLEEVLGHDDPFDVVEAVLVDRDPRVLVPDDEVLEVVDGGVPADADHGLPGGHDLADDPVAELDHAPQELVLALVDDALLGRLVDERLDLLVRGFAVLLLVLPLFLALEEVAGDDEQGRGDDPDEGEGRQEHFQEDRLADEDEEPRHEVEEEGVDGQGGEEEPEGPRDGAGDDDEAVDDEGQDDEDPQELDGQAGLLEVGQDLGPLRLVRVSRKRLREIFE